MSNTKERIKQFIDLKGISERKFSLAIGASEAYFTTTKSIGSDFLEKIAAVYPDLDMHWVITGTTSFGLTPDEYNHVGSNIRHLRINGGYTSAEYSKLLDINKEELFKYETGITLAPPELIGKICKIFLGSQSIKKFYKESYNSYPRKDPDLNDLAEKLIHTDLPKHILNDSGNDLKNENWKEKYYELMERYTSLLEQLNKLKNTG